MEKILKVDDLCFGYTEEDFLKNISFDVGFGEIVSVVGENGSGKSTLFKVINGLLNGYQGKILYKDNDIKKLKFSQKAKEIAVLYQNTECDFPFTCFDIVAMGLYPHKKSFSSLSKQDIDFIEYIMNLTDTMQFAYKNINSISGGQAQRVLLARPLVQKPKLLFFDEAMSGLDISARIKMTQIISDECKKNNTSVLIVTHDINLAFETSDKIVALKNGQVYSFGTPKDLLNIDFFREVFNVEVEIDEYKKYFRIIYK